MSLESNHIILHYLLEKSIKLKAQHNLVCKTLRTDNGTEFQRSLTIYLHEEGIVHQLGDAYKHHQPACAERSHRKKARTGHAPSITDFIPFGSVVNAHDPIERRINKLHDVVSWDTVILIVELKLTEGISCCAKIQQKLFTHLIIY